MSPARPDPLDRYCPTCRRRRGRDDCLCPECGDRTHRRGYCLICEDRLDAPSGGLCPKHETALEDDPPKRPTDAGADLGDWVTVIRFPYPSLAIAPRLLLESEGIPTFLDGERVASEIAYTLATGGVRLQVPRSMADQARALLRLPEDVARDEPSGEWYRPLALAALAVGLFLTAAAVVRLIESI